jgi:hypothetical protein
MRQRNSRVQESKQDHNSPPLARERNRSAVLACTSPYNTEDTAKESPPYPAWPEIEHRYRFYTLPTMGALYQPGTGVKGLMKEFVHNVPHLGFFTTRLLPMVLEWS